MANKDLAVRFSDEMYATRGDVARALNTSLIDGIWKSIEEYRNNYSSNLMLHSINKTPFYICLMPTLVDRISALERKLTKAQQTYNKFADNSLEKFKFRKDYFGKSITFIARKQTLTTNEELLKATFNEDEKYPYTLSQRILRNYSLALKSIEKNTSHPFNEDFLAEMYSTLTENTELTHLYRNKDFDDPRQKVIINREYVAAPFDKIEPLMSELFLLVNSTSLSLFTKSIVAYFYINYLKPFETYNEEISMLAIKKIIASESGEMSVLIPFERIISDRQENYKNYFKEVQRSNDLTYVLNACTFESDEIFNDLLDSLAKMHVNEIKEEFYSVQTEKDAKPVESEAISLFDENESSKEADKIINQTPVATKVEEVKKEIEPIKIEEAKPKIVVPQKVEEVKKEIPKVEEVKKEVKVVPQVEHRVKTIVVPEVNFGLDEEEASKFEEYLLETNPTLKKGQAYFYARHCTIGKYYTIQQYKHTLNCVYETARTSMDNLANLGYYRKEGIKNKFVYTPVGKDQK